MDVYCTRLPFLAFSAKVRQKKITAHRHAADEACRKHSSCLASMDWSQGVGLSKGWGGRSDIFCSSDELADKAEKKRAANQGGRNLENGSKTLRNRTGKDAHLVFVCSNPLGGAPVASHWKPLCLLLNEAVGVSSMPDKSATQAVVMRSEGRSAPLHELPGRLGNESNEVDVLLSSAFSASCTLQKP